MIKKTVLGLIALSFFAVSCSSDNDNGIPSTSELILNLDGLEALGTDDIYEGWVIGGSGLCTGAFTAFNTVFEVTPYSRLSARQLVAFESFFENEP